MARIEFSAKTRDQAFARSCGRCEWREAGIRCDAILTSGNVEFDHILPLALGGESVLANAQALCKTHHKLKTSKGDVPRIRKADRQRRGHIGAKISNAPVIESRGFAEPAPKNRSMTKRANGERRLYVNAEE